MGATPAGTARRCRRGSACSGLGRRAAKNKDGTHQTPRRLAPAKAGATLPMPSAENVLPPVFRYRAVDFAAAGIPACYSGVS